MMQYPLVNGKRYSFASVTFSLGNISIFGVTDISYSHSLEPGEVRGAHPQVLGYTRGEYSCEASVTFLKEEWDEAVKQLDNSVGLLEVIVPVVTITYADQGAPTVTDKLMNCRIQSIEVSTSTGSDPVEVVVSLMPTHIEMNGRNPLARMLPNR